MSSRRVPPDSIVVFTTPERADYFACATGPGADMRFDPAADLPLADMLANCAASGARVVVLDEDHFFPGGDLREGIVRYLDDPQSRMRSCRLVVACSGRTAGDPFLRFLVSYCHVTDVVYGCEGAELCRRVARAVHEGMDRLDVLELLEEPAVRACDAAVRDVREATASAPSAAAAGGDAGEPAQVVPVALRRGDTARIELRIEINVIN